MYIARILYPVQVLGPGKRVGIWFVGCKHKCKGCSNPELWNINETSYVTIEQVEKLIRNVAKENVIDGFTITGGDPMEQASEIADLLEKVKDISEDVMLYTGYEIAELTSDMHKKLLNKVAVLIDGCWDLLSMQKNNTLWVLVVIESMGWVVAFVVTQPTTLYSSSSSIIILLLTFWVLKQPSSV